MSDVHDVRAALRALDRNVPADLDDRAALCDGIARVTASWWSTGRDTDSCAFVSTGAVPDNPADLWRSLVPDYLSLDGLNRRALDFLAGYLLRHAGRGPVPHWYRVWVPSAVDSEAS
jgi:hypothetical protein